MSTNVNGVKELNDHVDQWWKRTLNGIHVERAAGRMLILVVIAFAGFSFLVPHIFMTGLNFQNMALSVPETGLLAVAMMVAMLTGGIDLSLVSIANLSPSRFRPPSRRLRQATRTWRNRWVRSLFSWESRWASWPVPSTDGSSPSSE